MLETIPGNLYDYPKYYDLVFGSDWKAEFDFLEACFDHYASGEVTRLFEPACGTGRLLYRFGKVGYDVAGNDLNPKAVDFCNARLRRHGLTETAMVGDMADFRLPRKVDAAFNTINSFRHLSSQKQAVSHLQCVANALRKGGIYVLGLHLTPTDGPPLADEESWAARRGNLSVLSRMWTLETNMRRRCETVGMSFDVYTPTRSFRLVNRTDFRTYTARQMDDLLKCAPALRIAGIHDFAYRIDQQVTVDETVEDVIYVLKKT